MTQPKTAKSAAAAKEVAGGALSLTFKGHEFTVPAALPFRVLERIRDEDFVGVVEILLDGQMPAFWALDPSLVEVTEDFLPNALAAYGLDQGESSASTGS